MSFQYKKIDPIKSNYATQDAARNGDLDYLQYLHKNGCEWDVFTTTEASKYGHLNCLKYALENGCDWNYFTSYNAVKYGHLDCLKYMHQFGCRFFKRHFTRIAAEFGHLDCLKYILENDGEWDEVAPVNAASNGHMECFKYCFQTCPDPKAFWNNIYKYNVEIINQIDLDDKVWSILLYLKLNLIHYPNLQLKIDNRKKEIKDKVKNVLQNKLSLDIIYFHIFLFL
jgi:hypothetical protein